MANNHCFGPMEVYIETCDHFKQIIVFFYSSYCPEVFIFIPTFVWNVSPFPSTIWRWIGDFAEVYLSQLIFIHSSIGFLADLLLRCIRKKHCIGKDSYIVFCSWRATRSIFFPSYVICCNSKNVKILSWCCLFTFYIIFGFNLGVPACSYPQLLYSVPRFVGSHNRVHPYFERSSVLVNLHYCLFNLLPFHCKQIQSDWTSVSRS